MTGPLTGTTLLLVHGDPLLRHDHAIALARAGARVRSSARAEDVRRLTEAEDVDAVIWDLEGTASGAVSAIREIRAAGMEKRRSVVALGLGPVIDDWDPRGRGAFDGYAPVPITPEQLVARVSALLGRQRGREARTTRRLPRLG